jgi:hypothetical protein
MDIETRQQKQEERSLTLILELLLVKLFIKDINWIGVGRIISRYKAVVFLLHFYWTLSVG